MAITAIRQLRFLIMFILVLRSSGVTCDRAIAGGFRREAYTKDPAEVAAEASQMAFRDKFTPDPFGGGGGKARPPDDAEMKFTTVKKTTKLLVRTTPERVSQKEECDYLAYYCLKAYRTGKICGRTLYYKYQSFTNYCLLDYVNCKEGYEVWQIVHMGECFNVETVKEYKHYVYDDDSFLDQIYVYND